MSTVTILLCSDSNDYINNINEDMIVTVKLISIISDKSDCKYWFKSNKDRWFITRVVVIVDIWYYTRTNITDIMCTIRDT